MRIEHTTVKVTTHKIKDKKSKLEPHHEIVLCVSKSSKHRLNPVLAPARHYTVEVDTEDLR
jgi:hypothetical protein